MNKAKENKNSAIGIKALRCGNPEWTRQKRIRIVPSE